MDGQLLGTAVKVGLFGLVAYTLYRVAGNQLAHKREYTREQLDEAQRRYGLEYYGAAA
jgi:hypothetical protein